LAGVSAHPQLGARRGVISDGGVVGMLATILAPAGHEHPRPVRANRDRVGRAAHVGRAVVMAHPELGARRAVIADGAVAEMGASWAVAAGDEDGTGRAGGYRVGSG